MTSEEGKNGVADMHGLTFAAGGKSSATRFDDLGLVSRAVTLAFLGVFEGRRCKRGWRSPCRGGGSSSLSSSSSTESWPAEELLRSVEDSHGLLRGDLGDGGPWAAMRLEVDLGALAC